MDNLEAVYDQEIAPLMSQILTLCQARGIPMFASFQISNDGFCTSAIAHNAHPVFRHYQALAQSIQEGGVNLDKYVFWVAREARGHAHSSMVLKQMGVPVLPDADQAQTA